MWRSFWRVALNAALLCFLGGTIWAQDVTLTSRDGTITLEGSLKGYDGEFYRIETPFGPLTVDAQGVVCDGPGCPDLTAFVAEIRLSGSARMGDVLMPALVERFGMDRGLQVRRIVQDDTHFRYDLSDPVTGRPVARFHFRISTTDEGFADLVADEADLAMALREVRPAEVARGKEAGIGDLSGPRRARIVALDGLVPVVSRANLFTTIGLAQLRDLLSGEVKSWSALLGNDAPVQVYGREKGSGAAQLVSDRIGAEASADAPQMRGFAALVDAVARDPNAIGVTMFSELGAAKPLTLSGPCGRPLRADQVSLKTEDYPLSAPMFLYTPARRLPLVAREFLGYLSGSSAQLVIRRAGFVDQSPASIPLAAQGQRLGNAISAAGNEGSASLADLQEMIDALEGAARLTTTFRFRGGASRMDAQSEGNVAQLARAIEAGLYDGRELIFAGFSDGQGAANVNKRLSRKRAQAARDAVRELAASADWSRLRLTVKAFGEALPLGCDEVEWGRRVNRRVEVWIR